MYYKSMTVNELVAKARGRRQRDGGKTAAQQKNTHPAAIRQPIPAHPGENVHWCFPQKSVSLHDITQKR